MNKITETAKFVELFAEYANGYGLPFTARTIADLDLFEATAKSGRCTIDSRSAEIIRKIRAGEMILA